MKAKCPNCSTVFKLTEDQLEVAGGMVRCGMCQDVFNALHNIDDPFADDNEKDTNKATAGERPAAPPVEKAIETLTETLNRKNDTLPGEPVKELSQALADLSHIHHAEQSDIKVPPFEDEKKAADELFENVQSKLIPDEFRIPELKTPYSVWKDISWSLAILLFTASLFVEYAWFYRHDLAANPQLRPYVTKICNFADCEAMELRYPKEIEMVSRNIYSHPNVSNALMVSLSMVNHTTFAQPFPNIKISFSDVSGSVVASRVFLPEEYLQLKKKSLRLLPPEALTDISMEIKDPGPRAMTYEFNFL
jgi:predicted Zn finger-like uncharacterized protein